jgi:flagellar basal body rod protein FlgG
MMFARFSLRSMFFAVTLVGVALSGHARSGNIELQPTGNPLDLSVVGSGYLICTNPENNEQIFFRSARLHTDQNGCLSICHQGKSCPLAPAITIPLDGRVFEIKPNGYVSVLQNGVDVPISVGSMQLATFSRSEQFTSSTKPWLTREQAGIPPMICSPGDNGAGLIQSGWSVRQRSALSELLELRASEYVIIALLGVLILNSFSNRNRIPTQA